MSFENEQPASDPRMAARHRLSAPLEIIADLARLALETDDATERQGCLERLLRTAKGLMATLDDVLDFDRLVSESVSIDSRPFDMRRIVESLTEAMALRLGERPVELVCLVADDVPRWVVGDARRIDRILVELLDNAIRFTDSGLITVQCAWSDCLVLRVSDTGPGIPPLEQARLFEPRTGPHRPQAGIWRARAGAGLGLGLCGTLVELMGGRIACDSLLSQGTTIEVRLPLEAHGESERRLPQRIEGRVLLVEDHAELRAGLARDLEDLGFLVDEAADGREALRRVRQAQGPYDLALLDGELGDAPGAALTDLLDGRPTLGDAPRVLMQRNPRADGGRAVRKPVTRWRLQRAVERALGRRLPVAEPGGGRDAEGDRRVLVVDDNPDSRLLAARILRAHRLEVHLAEHGLAAVREAAAVAYDLILMDIEMPHLDGLEASRRIRRGERSGRRVPIVAVTAHDGAEFRSQCIEAGMDDFVPRPVDRKTLLRAVERVLGIETDQPDAAHPTEAPPGDPLDAPLPSVRFDPDLLDLMPGFINHRWADVRALRGWLTDPTSADPRGVAHGLKGVGGAFGFPAITHLGAALGAAVKAGERRRAERCIERLETHLHQIEAAFARIADPSGSARSDS